ncbi:MAG: hypothetical protein PHX78_10155 [bacterium]|nr:hypothetical protein [bacterium]
MYLEDVENYFCKKKGKSLILSPKDWLLIKKWFTEGIPLALILQGIDTTFANNPNPKRINSISYCESEILSAWELYKENMIGSARKEDPKDAPAFILDRISGIIKMLAERTEKGKNKLIYEHILSLFENMNNLLLKDRQALTFLDAEQKFNQNQNEIVQYLIKCLGPKENAEIEDKIESDLLPYKKRMPRKTFEETKEQLLQKEVLKKFSLTNIGLYD